MTLEYTFNMDDYMEFQKFYLQNSPEHKKSLRLIRFSVPLGFCIGLSAMIIKGRLNLYILMFFLIISILWMLFYPKRAFKNTLKRLRKQLENGDNSVILGKQSLELHDDYLFLGKEESETKFKWSAVKRYEENEAYFFLFTSVLGAIVIPKKNLNISPTEVERRLNEKLL